MEDCGGVEFESKARSSLGFGYVVQNQKKFTLDTLWTWTVAGGLVGLDTTNNTTATEFRHR